MKISSAVVLGLLTGAVTGFVGMGTVVGLNPRIGVIIHNYAWWIVLLCMLVPLADYLSGIRTTLLGVVTRHPYRHLAGFFCGVAVGLAFLLLLLPNLASLRL